MVEGLEHLKVCDLFIPGLKEWDEELIEGIFEPRDAATILEILLRQGQARDERIWGLTIWRKMGLLSDVERARSGSESFKDWLFKAIHTMPTNKMQALAA
ncbi:hypothetical protein LINPERHAP2_LOCUS39945 [Linum perenne]